VRRSLGDYDWQMIDWGQQIGCATHILLTKADKLKRGAAINILNQVRKETEGQVGVQLFSATKRTGLDEARNALDAMLLGGGSAQDDSLALSGK